MTAAATRSGRPMGLWRLEWLRMWRGRRILALLAPFVFFGVLTPFLTRYMDELLRASSNGQFQVSTPPPTAAASLGSYTGNIAQIGLLVFALVLASSLALGAHREIAVFFRTRVRSPADLVVPRYTVTVLVTAAAFLLGTACAAVGTELLIGGIDAAGVAVASLLVCVYLAFIGSVTAVIAARFDSVIAAAAVTLAVAVVLALVGSVEAIGRWLPSELVGSLAELGSGQGAPSDYLPSLGVTVAATAGLLAQAVRVGGTREL